MKGHFVKRIMAVLLALSMITSLSVVGVSAANTSRFKDVSSSHWAYDEIVDVVDKGVFKGTGKDTFEPEMEMTRSMFVTVLARLAGVEVNDRAKTDFRDVPTGTWYTGAVAWASKEGIVKGTSTTRFAPDDVITREQMATMILRYTDYLDLTLPKTENAVRFADDRDISAFAEEAVEACQRAGLLNGVGNNRFLPQGTASRSQVAALISRLAELDGAIAYTVEFVTNVSNKTVAPQTVISGDKATQPSVKRAGYALLGWYTDAKFTQRYSFNAKVYSNLTLYAKWTWANSNPGDTYYDPTIPEPAQVDDYLSATNYKGIHLTYPSLTMDGNELVLSGVYEAAASLPGFDANYYRDGYVVPIKMTAPSGYTTGGKVHLKVTGSVKDIDTDITPVGDNWFYLLMFVPDQPGRSWDPQITVTWGGDSILYTLDVSGMAKALASGESHVVELKEGDGDFQGYHVTLPRVMAAEVKEKENEYDLYLSGGYVTGLNSGYPGGYLVPLRFTFPGDAFTGTATVEVKGAVGNEKKTFQNQSAIDYLFYLPASLPSGWNGVITVTWTQAVDGWFSSQDNARTRTLSYHVDVSGMHAVTTLKTPAPATDAQMKASTEKEGSDNAAFKGIENYTADVSFTKFTSSGGVKSAAMSGTYAYLPAGREIPGFGVVGTDINSDSIIVPLAFDIPAYLNLDALSAGSTLLTYKMYRGDQKPSDIAAMNKTVAQIGSEDLFLYWLKINQTDGKVSDELKTYGIRFDLTWAGGYQESFIFKLGDLKASTVTSKAPAVPTLNQVTELTKDNSDPFHGIAPLLTFPAITPATSRATGVYQLGGSYQPIVKGRDIPGFGTAGDAAKGLDGDFCILPILFSPPDNLRLDWIGEGDNAVTISVWKSADGGVTQTPVNIDVKQTKAQVKNGLLYLLQLNDPQKAAGNELKFVLNWYGGTTETFFFSFENFTRKTINAAGEKYNTTAKERQELANQNRLSAIDTVDIRADSALGGDTTLKLSRLGAPQSAEALAGFQGGKGAGYVVALKFARPSTAAIAMVKETVTGGYQSADAQVKDAVTVYDNGYTLLLYIPVLAPRWEYAPVIKLDWQDKDGRSLLTQTFKLDLTGMDIAFPR